ncbi:hypothetical protein [Bryocella elongata]|uniref:hypothetical protein n=1 Tax=Bryocella elongata TaxID=863522 RepID=UPI0011B06BCE|nr:hypothetical protein [Bryocella elongata]
MSWPDGHFPRSAATMSFVLPSPATVAACFGLLGLSAGLVAPAFAFAPQLRFEPLVFRLPSLSR